ncbi:MAG: hypothetical protein BroJett029_02490 [Alphaproteobacteria bacterium]|nr:MAG: hypothetical protein BroJett029_02490 [Alphaproteobacteria bacterium]
MSRSPFAFALVAALALAGCSSTPFGDAGKIHYVRVESGYSRSDFAYGAAGRDMTTEILGNPFPGISQAAFDQAVTDAMQGAHFGRPTHFTTTPDDSARPVYRVRMLWNGPLSANGGRLCDGTDFEGGGGPHPDGEARLLVAFCRSDRPATYLVGSIGGVTGPDDPRFVSFVRQVTTQLFPPRDGTFEPGECNWQTC